MKKYKFIKKIYICIYENSNARFQIPEADNTWSGQTVVSL